MTPRCTANILSKIQRDLLIDHVDSQLPVITSNASRHMSIRVLVEHGLLQYDDAKAFRPQFTKLTPVGREVVCMILGDYADALVQTGYLHERLNIRLPRPVAIELPQSIEGKYGR